MFNVLGCSREHFEYLKKRYLEVIKDMNSMSDIDVEMRYLLIRIGKKYPFLVPVWCCASHAYGEGADDEMSSHGYLVLATCEEMTEKDMETFRRLLERWGMPNKGLRVEYCRLIYPDDSNGEVWYNVISLENTIRLIYPDDVYKLSSKRRWIFNIYRAFDDLDG